MGQQTLHKVDREVPVDIPEKREYTTKENANLDESLCEAIKAAENADEGYLAGVLANELGSHYYSTR